MNKFHEGRLGDPYAQLQKENERKTGKKQQKMNEQSVRAKVSASVRFGLAGHVSATSRYTVNT